MLELTKTATMRSLISCEQQPWKSTNVPLHYHSNIYICLSLNICETLYFSHHYLVLNDWLDVLLISINSIFKNNHLSVLSLTYSWLYISLICHPEFVSRYIHWKPSSSLLNCVINHDSTPLSVRFSVSSLTLFQIVLIF